MAADRRQHHSTAPFALAGQGNTPLAGGNFPLAFYNGSNEFIFPRNSEVSDMCITTFLSKRVGVDQTDNDPYMAVVDSASSGILNGAAAAAIGTQYLVVWMDGRRRVVDPPQQTNVFGALIDGTQPGLNVRPYIRPGPAVAAPIVGDAPLSVAFSAGTSTGLIDGGQWDFGDGTTSIVSAVTHKYTTPGSYMAIYTLYKSGLNYNTFVNIDVASNDIGGAGGPPQTIGGIASPPEAGVNTKIACESFSASLSFTKSDTDSFHLSGVFNVSHIPLYITGQNVAVTIGTNSYSFNLLAGGTFTSTSGTKPLLNFSMNTFNGAFDLTGSSDSLLGALSGSGVANTTATKLAVEIPISVAFAGLTGRIKDHHGPIHGQGGRQWEDHVCVRNDRQTGRRHLCWSPTEPRIEQPDLSPQKPGTQDSRFPEPTANITPPNGARGGGREYRDFWSITIWKLYAGRFRSGSLKLKNHIYTLPRGNARDAVQNNAIFLQHRKSGGFVARVEGIPSEGEDASGMALRRTIRSRARTSRSSVVLALANGGNSRQDHFCG